MTDSVEYEQARAALVEAMALDAATVEAWATCSACSGAGSVPDIGFWCGDCHGTGAVPDAELRAELIDHYTPVMASAFDTVLVELSVDRLVALGRLEQVGWRMCTAGARPGALYALGDRAGRCPQCEPVFRVRSPLPAPDPEEQR